MSMTKAKLNPMFIKVLNTQMPLDDTWRTLSAEFDRLSDWTAVPVERIRIHSFNGLDGYLSPCSMNFPARDCIDWNDTNSLGSKTIEAAPPDRSLTATLPSWMANAHALSAVPAAEFEQALAFFQLHLGADWPPDASIGSALGASQLPKEEKELIGPRIVCKLPAPRPGWIAVAEEYQAALDAGTPETMALFVARHGADWRPPAKQSESFVTNASAQEEFIADALTQQPIDELLRSYPQMLPPEPEIAVTVSADHWLLFL